MIMFTEASSFICLGTVVLVGIGEDRFSCVFQQLASQY